MTYTMERDGSLLCVRVSGRLDIQSSPVLEEALEGQLEGVSQLTIDLAEVEYVSSMGLRLLLALRKRMSKQGAMQVAGANGAVRELFDETGFSNILTLV